MIFDNENNFKFELEFYENKIDKFIFYNRKNI